MSEHVITGAAKLKISDQVHTLFIGGRIFKIAIFAFVGMMLLNFVVSFLYGPFDIGFFFEILASSAGVFVGTMLILIIPLQVLLYFRLSLEQRDLRWEIDDLSISVLDGTGAKIVSPWGQVKKVHENKSGFGLFMKPAGLRWIPKRAFDEQGIASFKRLIEIKNLK